MTEPCVTVAMVAYNSEKYLREAIASVLAQDFRDFELLICDDCSTDRTWSIIEGFKDERIRAIRNPSNIGEYRNRNQAISLARGRYLMFLDGDDYLYRHGLELMVKMLEQSPRSAFASAQPPSQKFIFPVELTPHQFFSCQFLGPNVTGRDFTQLLFRTESLRAVGGFDTRFRTGDTHIQFRIGLKEGCLLVSDGVAWWRRYPGQASESVIRDLWGLAELFRYGREVLEDVHCPLSAQDKELARSNLSRLFLRNVTRFIRRGRLIHAAQLLHRGGATLSDWRYLFARDHRPYLSHTGGKNPVRGRLSESPLSSASAPAGSPRR